MGVSNGHAGGGNPHRLQQVPWHPTYLWGGPLGGDVHIHVDHTTSSQPRSAPGCNACAALATQPVGLVAIGRVGLQGSAQTARGAAGQCQTYGPTTGTGAQELLDYLVLMGEPRCKQPGMGNTQYQIIRVYPFIALYPPCSIVH